MSTHAALLYCCLYLTCALVLPEIVAPRPSLCKSAKTDLCISDRGNVLCILILPSHSMILCRLVVFVASGLQGECDLLVFDKQ